MYDVLAPGYDELYREEQEKKLALIAHVIKGNVLDIGAGTGIVARHFPNVVSLDPSPEMLAYAPGEKIVGSAEAIPFPSGRFDTIVSLTALHHCNIDKVITELQRLQPKNMAFTILKKSQKCQEIVEKLQMAFGMDIIDEEKDLLVIKETKD
ncbi:MAG TPA: class I SAM-dependent methyltransferase [Candidatus Nanoarchaeia archaeon]|nr:class I SAM-dependent methyltransferase [Candidatus Nanoarchaeia archaeon]